jgi:hypothetical protein
MDLRFQRVLGAFDAWNMAEAEKNEWRENL